MTEGNYYKVCVSNSSPVYKHETADFYLFHDEKSDKKWIISKGNIDFTPIDFSRFFDLGNYFNVAIILFQQFAFHLFPFFWKHFFSLIFFQSAFILLNFRVVLSNQTNVSPNGKGSGQSTESLVNWNNSNFRAVFSVVFLRFLSKLFVFLTTIFYILYGI